jgi:hypothetical protein
MINSNSEPHYNAIKYSVSKPPVDSVELYSRLAQNVAWIAILHTKQDRTRRVWPWHMRSSGRHLRVCVLPKNLETGWSGLVCFGVCSSLDIKTWLAWSCSSLNEHRGSACSILVRTPLVSYKAKEKIAAGVKVNSEIECDWAEWRFTIVMRFGGICHKRCGTATPCRQRANWCRTLFLNSNVSCIFHVNFCTPYCLTSHEICIVVLTLKEFFQKFGTHSVCFLWVVMKFFFSFIPLQREAILNHLNLCYLQVFVLRGLSLNNSVFCTDTVFVSFDFHNNRCGFSPSVN